MKKKVELKTIKIRVEDYKKIRRWAFQREMHIYQVIQYLINNERRGG